MVRTLGTVFPKGKSYTSYTVPEHIDGRRRLLTFANLETNYLNDRDEVISWQETLSPEILRALEAVEPTGVTILPAAMLFTQAVKILNGKTDELLTACQYWMQHRPDAPLDPKLGKDAVTAYLQRRTHLSERRKRNLSAQLDWFRRKFGDLPLHEVKPQQVRALMDERKWGNKTRNDFLSRVYGHQLSTPERDERH